MSTQLILDLPEETYERVAQFAACAKRNVSEIIAAALASLLPSLDAIAQLRNVAKLSDREVLALTELRLASDVDHRLSELLNRKQAGELTELEQAELAALMRMYEMGLLRQSQALAEAVKRGLIPPLHPRRQKWRRHFAWSDEGTWVNGRTACGRATVIALNLNNEIALVVRRNWVSADWHPPPS